MPKISNSLRELLFNQLCLNTHTILDNINTPRVRIPLQMKDLLNAQRKQTEIRLDFDVQTFSC